MQLAQLASDWRGHVLPHGMMAETKFDGFRCLRFKDIEGKPRLWTRNGIPIEGCDHIAYRLDLIEAQAGEPLFIDGELVVDGSLAATKHWVETGHKFGGEKGEFYAFDVIPYRDWQRGRCDTPLYQRKAMLKSLIESADDPWEWRAGSRGRDEGATPVHYVEDEWVFGADHALSVARQRWAENLEGVMLKDPESIYVRGRNTSWMKVKRENVHKWGATAYV